MSIPIPRPEVPVVETAILPRRAAVRRRQTPAGPLPVPRKQSVTTRIRFSEVLHLGRFHAWRAALGNRCSWSLRRMAPVIGVTIVAAVSAVAIATGVGDRFGNPFRFATNAVAAAFSGLEERPTKAVPPKNASDEAGRVVAEAPKAVNALNRAEPQRRAVKKKTKRKRRRSRRRR